MLQGPTGSGKTQMGVQGFILPALEKGNSVSFVVPLIQLVDQTCETLLQNGVAQSNIDVRQGDHPWANPGGRVMVCSIDTLAARDHYPACPLAIIDEAHLRRDHIWKWMDKRPKTTFIGLSATPWSVGLGKYYSALVVASTTQRLIDDGFLAPFKVYAPSKPDLSGLSGLDYAQEALAERVMGRELISDVVDSWLKLGEGRSTICFAVNRAHAKLIQNQFLSRGVKADYVDAFTELTERREIKRRLHAHETQIVVNVGVLTAGTDWDIGCLILACPTKSEARFVQMVGRVLRTSEQWPEAIIIDHSDTHERLGFVTDIHHPRLDTSDKAQGSIKKEKEALPKACSKCAFMKPPKTPECPVCGHKAEKQSGVDTIDGELVELTNKRDNPELWAKLISYARDKGKKDGWAWYTVGLITGKKPEGSPPKPIQWTEEIPNMVKYGYIKSKSSRKK